MGANGWRIDQVFQGSEGRAFNDIVFIPGIGQLKESEAMDARASLSNAVTLQIPFVGVDIATADAAIALACAGGLGIISHSQPLDKQVAAVKKVRGCMANFILEPATLSPLDTIADFERLQDEIGRTGVCITDSGDLGGKLLGVVSSSDADTAQDKEQHLSKVMTTQVLVGQERLEEPITLQEARQLMCKGKVGKLPIVNSSMQLVGLVTRRDYKQALAHPNASRDDNGQLLVGAAILAGHKDDFHRVKVLVEAGAMILYVDISECEKESHLELIRQIKVEFPTIDVIVGKVSSCRQAKRACEAGADVLLVGTPTPTSWTAPQVSSGAEASILFEVAKYARFNHGVSSIAAAPMMSTGQMLKALCLGAAAVAPGKALGPDGSEQESIAFHTAGVTRGMRELGIKTIPQLHEALLEGELRVELRSAYSVLQGQ
mmetsp:Transcript_56688/g.104956  ORF Transcript_56688/g.104956 Transcript_56688/m.104956 type:complete len:432 (+) Transcript_56688:100-1395(+)